MSCYSWDGLERFIVVVAAWVACAVSLCVVCCCFASDRRSQYEYQQAAAADGVYLAVENNGRYGRML